MIGYFNTYIQKYWEDNQKVQTYTELGLSLLLMIIFLAFAIRPTLSTVLELNKKYNEAKAADERLDAKIESIGQAQANLNDLIPKQAVIDAAIPTKQYIIDFLNQAQILAAQAELTLTQLDYQDPNSGSISTNRNKANASTSQPNLQKLSFSIGGVGQYPNIRTLTSRLENMPRVVQINQIAIRQAEETGTGLEEEIAEGQLDFTISGTIYYWEE